MRKKVKFSQLTKKDKIFKIINLAFMLSIFLASAALAIYYGVTGDPNDRLVPAILVGVVSLLPYLFELIFRTRLNNILFLGLEIYLLFAGFIGATLNFYNMFSWYDIVIHVIMGYLVAMLALFFIARLGDYKKLSVWQVVVFCLCFSLAVELVWELSEWAFDNLFGMSAQGDKVSAFGQLAPLVTDTMEDILCNFSGALLFFIHFILGKKALPLGINAIERELTETKINVMQKEPQITDSEGEEAKEAETKQKKE